MADQDRLRYLVEMWRFRMGKLERNNDMQAAHRADVYRLCAQELDAALSTAQPAPCPECGGTAWLSDTGGDRPCPRCSAQPAPCPECVEFARLFSTVNVAAMKDEGATAEEMRRSLVECRGAVAAAAKVWDKVKVSGRPAPAGVVVPRDVADAVTPFLAMLLDPDVGGVRYVSDEVKVSIQALAVALRQGGE